MKFQSERDFVKNEFQKCKEHKGIYGFREKWSHTERVIKWAKRLLEKEHADGDILLMAAIFHDVGYTVSVEPKDHPKYSEIICRTYLMEHNYPEEFIDKVCVLIKNHSDKNQLRADNKNLEQVLLIEADCLDENGAMSIIRDAICEGMAGDTSYRNVYSRILRFPLEEEIFDCVTNTAKEIWEEKRRIFWEFTKSLQEDVE